MTAKHLRLALEVALLEFEQMRPLDREEINARLRVDASAVMLKLRDAAVDMEHGRQFSQLAGKGGAR
jgi:hypothetical protein